MHGYTGKHNSFPTDAVLQFKSLESGSAFVSIRLQAAEPYFDHNPIKCKFCHWLY